MRYETKMMCEVNFADLEPNIRQKAFLQLSPFKHFVRSSNPLQAFLFVPRKITPRKVERMQSTKVIHSNGCMYKYFLTVNHMTSET